MENWFNQKYKYSPSDQKLIGQTYIVWQEYHVFDKIFNSNKKIFCINEKEDNRDKGNFNMQIVLIIEKIKNNIKVNKWLSITSCDNNINLCRFIRKKTTRRRKKVTPERLWIW